ncbi:MAG TPA: GAF domain-containing protein [Acidimicrobiales bacterium]|nr:GAF domain-containing protein [Acidimicrobiales bacterium]
MGKEISTARTFVELADDFDTGFDAIDLLGLLTTRCVELLDVAGAGVLFAADADDPQAAASSHEAVRGLNVFEVQSREGPTVDCYGSGMPVMQSDLRGAYNRWPRYTPRAIHAGYQSVHAVPLCRGSEIIGALGLFHTEPWKVSLADVALAHAFADVATITILRHRNTGETPTLHILRAR